MNDEDNSESEFYYPDEVKLIESNDNSGNYHEAQTLCDEDQETTDSQEEIDSFLKQQKNQNTLRKTSSDMNTFYRYLKLINKENVQILHLPAEELDHLLSKFFKDIRKTSGEEYEPDTLSGFQRSIQRFLTENKPKINILRDEEFKKSREVLAAKRKQLVNKAGKGNKPHATRALTNGEEDKLFEAGQFGDSNPEVLQRTIWWFFAMHFGFRARDESRKLCWGDVELQQDPVQDGREMLVWLNERGTKTRKGQENGHQRPFQPKIYATESERCPVKYYKAFKSHRPVEMNKPDAPFFLAIRHGNRRENNHIWYMKAALGKNEIGKFLSKAADSAGLQRKGAKVSNHSVRKTGISRLLDANTPETFVAQLSGHKNLQSLQSYKSASEHHQRQMSYILSRSQTSCTASNQLQITSAPGPRLVELSSEQRSLPPLTSSSQRSLATRSASTLPLNVQDPNNNQAVFAGASIGNISGCQFQIFNGPVRIIQEPQKKRRYVIESDDED